MANILVVISSLKLDGHTSVCFEIIETLQEDHHVDLLVNQANGEDIDFRELNDSFGTNVTQEVISDNYIVDKLNNIYWTLKKIPIPYKVDLVITKVSNAIFINEYQSVLENYDLVIDTERGPHIGFRHIYSTLPYSGTDEEFTNYLSTPTIHFSKTPIIHYRHNAYKITKKSNIPGYLGIPRFIDWLCRKLVDINNRKDPNSTFVMNSDFTAERFEEAHDIPTETIYPPVDLGKFEPERIPWDQREDGFVTVGRLSPRKNQLKSIQAVEEMRDRGYDIHLHIVGDTNERYTEFAAQVLKKCENADYITYEGRLSDKELVTILCEHKFGIHAAEYERFGIVIGEMVAAGIIPFVPDSGGQTEVVNHIPELKYNNTDDLADNFERVYTDISRRDRIRDELMSSSARYSKEKFDEEISNLINFVINNQGDTKNGTTDNPQ